MPRSACLAICAALLLTARPAAAAPPATPPAAPRDELLRLAPGDAALVVLVQNARDHFHNVMESPFATWFPTTGIGKQLLESADLKQLRASSAAIFSSLDTAPAVLIEDVFGDAAAFAYSPATGGQPNSERAVLLIRPRKPDVLAKLLDRMNDLQTKSGELKGVVRREREGATYYERQKSTGGSDFYCFRGEVFAFSGSERDVEELIDRDKLAAPVSVKTPELVERIKKLGVGDAAAIVLINPRPLDGEVKARVAAAKPDEKRFLEKFAEVWAALDSAALYLTLDKNLEVGVSLRFLPGKLPANASKWLTGPRRATMAESLIPEGAAFGFSGEVRVVELIEMVSSLAPVAPGKPAVKEWIAQALGPVVGRDKLPLVLESLGPNWAVWAESPTKDGVLPVFVAAIEIQGEGETREKAEKAILQAVEFGFQTGRVAYNGRHVDQIEVKEEKDSRTGATIKTLVNDKGFPPGFRPSFALVRGYLVIATSPEAILRFDGPVPAGTQRNDYATIAKLSGTRTRAYFLTHGPKLAKFLADLGMGDEKKLREQLDALAAVLELIDSADVIVRGDENGMRLAARIKLAKPLKK